MNISLKYIITAFLIAVSIQLIGQESELTLSVAIEKALENNYGIVVSKSEVDIAEINNTWGTAGRYPTIGFSASSNNNAELINNTKGNTITAGLSLNWTLFNGFRVVVTKNKLEQYQELAKGRSGVVVENTIQNVILGFYNILLQQKRLEVLKNLMQLSEDRYKYEQTKYDIGGSVTYNVLLAKNVYLDDKAAYLNQDVVVKNTIRNLNFLLGEEPNKQWIIKQEFKSDTNDYKLGDLMDKMMASNRTLQNQYINLMLQQEEIKLQQSAWYPRVSLSAGINNSYAWYDQEGMQSNPVEGLTPYGNLSLSYNIFDAGNRKSAVDIAKINEQITQIETDEMKHSLTNQLYNEFEVYNLRKVLLNVSNESLEAAEMNLQIAEEKFKTGAINSFNYRDIQLNYLNSALNQLQSVYNLIYSNTTLTRLTGGFLDEAN